jgi:uncharacterized protein YbjT (DUF2867 family)
MQPIYVEDLADLAVSHGAGDENVTLDAVGPEKYTFNEWLDIIGDAVGARRPVMHLPPPMVFAATSVIGRMVGDVVLTRDEITGLMGNLLVSDQQPNAPTLLTDWMRDNASWLGTRYMSELKSHYK